MDLTLKEKSSVIVSLPPYEQSGSFDASQYKGLKIVVRGKGEPYFVHFKTTKTIFPWQFFKAEFIAPTDWQEVRIPFEKFQPENMKDTSFNTNRLKRIAIAASEKEYTAELSVARIEFYH